MSSIVIPKEQLTAFERWELASFDPHSDGLYQSPAQRSAALTNAAGLEQLRQQAQEEGYAHGHTTGYAEGIQQARNEAARMYTLMQNFQGALNQVDEQLAHSLLDLSLEIARKMVGETMLAKPEVILGIVSEAINNLPHFNQNAHLVLHPDDAKLVREHMGDQLAHAGWKIFTDTQLSRGGCRVETAHSQVDATTEARWKRVVESLGEDKSWLP
jgi:flagellar assembly protein FliH